MIREGLSTAGLALLLSRPEISKVMDRAQLGNKAKNEGAESQWETGTSRKLGWG